MPVCHRLPPPFAAVRRGQEDVQGLIDGVRVDDAELADGGELRFTLSATSGVLSIASTAGLTFTEPTPALDANGASGPGVVPEVGLWSPPSSCRLVILF